MPPADAGNETERKRSKMELEERKREIAQAVRWQWEKAKTDADAPESCASCPVQGHCEFVKCGVKAARRMPQPEPDKATPCGR